MIGSVSRCLLTLALLAITAPVWAEQTYHLQIESQPLGKALQRFAEQSGLQIVYYAQIAEGQMAGRVEGNLSAEEALKRLLAGTELTFKAVNGDTIAIKESLPQGATKRLTQVQEPQAVQTDQQAPPPQSADATEPELQEIMVTGTRIRGTAQLPAPIITFTKEDFERRGYTTLEQVVNDLPQNFSALNVGGATSTGASRLALSNSDRASGIDLRGLGAGATLTLLNGTRRAGRVFGQVADISAIPLSMIERIEIVSGSRSAVYGSDAVGGVVNILTRRTFDGFEIGVASGYGSRGGERTQTNAVFGSHSSRGGFVVGYDYLREQNLDLVKAGLTRPVPLGQIPRRSELLPDTWRHSALIAGQYDWNNRVTLYFDGQYTRKKFDSLKANLWPGGTQDSTDATRDNSDQYSLSAGTSVRVGSDWNLDLKGVYSRANADGDYFSFYDYGDGAVGSFGGDGTQESSIGGASVVAEGPLVNIRGREVRLAIGAERRKDSFLSFSKSENLVYNDASRNVNAAFVETSVPVTDRQARIGKLTLSLAGRYDDYSDAGSAFDYQLGAVWQPVDVFALRSTYATAFRAPAIVELAPYNYITLDRRSDLRSPSGFTTVLTHEGVNPSLVPEKADTWSVGFDYEPTLIPRTKLSLSYFNVNFRQRIDVPTIGADTALVLERESRFAQLIERAPTAAEAAVVVSSAPAGFFSNSTGTAFDPQTQADQILQLFPDLVIFDNRTNNIAVENVHAIDLRVENQQDLLKGVMRITLNGTYTLDHDRRITRNSPDLDLINEVGKPVDLRARFDVDWKRGGFGANLGVNYTDGYANPFSIVEGRIASWTTLDLTLRIDGGALSEASWARGLNASLSVSNILDRDPPEFIGSIYGLRFDATNSNPLGRYGLLSFRKSW
jgi:outer membrane receptor protein involved in Fe transport